VWLLKVFPCEGGRFVVEFEKQDVGMCVGCAVVYVHRVSKMGSHITWYALIALDISECWPEDGLIRSKHVVAITILIFIHCCCVLMLTLKHCYF